MLVIIALLVLFGVPIWLGINEYAWAWVFLIGAPVAFLTRPIVTYNLLKGSSFGQLMTWLVMQTVIMGVISSAIYWIARAFS